MDSIQFIIAIYDFGDECSDRIGDVGVSGRRRRRESEDGLGHWSPCTIWVSCRLVGRERPCMRALLRQIPLLMNAV